MLKTKYLVIAAALMTGTALGFMDIFLLDGKTEYSVEKDKSTVFSQTAPKFIAKQTKKDLSRITPSLSTVSVLIPHYAAMSAAELKAEIKRLGELPPKGASTAAAVEVSIQYLILRLARDFPEEVGFYLDNEMDKNVKRHAVALLEEWSKNDFDGAMGYLLANRSKFNFSTGIFNSMLQQLAANNLDKAMEWGFAQKGKIRQKALSEMVKVLVDNQPEKIADLVSRLLPEDLKKGGMLADISEKWGSCDWESAMRWADTLSEKRRKEAIVGILGGLSSVDLEKATEEFKKQPQQIQGEIAKILVENLSNNESYGNTSECSGRKQAIAWIMENATPGQDTDKLTRNLLGSSSSLTPELIDHVKKLPDGSIRDNALLSMAKMTTYMAEYGQFTYEDAFALTDLIKDDKTKKESILNNVSNWISDDPESARVWIEEKSVFTAEEKQRQLQACEKSLQYKKENPQEKKVFSKNMVISTYEG